MKDFQLLARVVFKSLGSLSKDDVHNRYNVIWKRNFVSAIISQLFQVIKLAKCVLSILELNWNEHFREKKTKLKICRHVLTPSTQRQNRSLHVVERTRTTIKCTKMKDAWANSANYCVSWLNMHNRDVKASDRRYGGRVDSIPISNLQFMTFRFTACIS